MTTTSKQSEQARFDAAIDAKRGCPEFAALWAGVAAEARAMADAARTLGMRNARTQERRALACEQLRDELLAAVKA